jgi:hypothetical protein
VQDLLSVTATSKHPGDPAALALRLAKRHIGYLALMGTMGAGR